MMKYMCDTNIINLFVDGLIDLSDLPKNLFATHLQLTEILKTKDNKRREELKKAFQEFSFNTTPLQTFLVGKSCAGDIVGKGPLHEIIQKKLKPKKSKADSNLNDALIGETAILEKFILITADIPFGKIIESLGGTVSIINQNNLFLKKLIKCIWGTPLDLHHVIKGIFVT